MLYVLPDSAGDILVVQGTQELTQDDYQDVFLPQIEKQLKPGHKLRVMLYLDHDLTKIEENSSWQSQNLFNDCEASIIRLAIVSNDQWTQWVSTFASEPVSHFPVSRFLDALHWLDEADIEH